jgi:hypothetical protein
MYKYNITLWKILNNYNFYLHIFIYVLMIICYNGEYIGYNGQYIWYNGEYTACNTPYTHYNLSILQLIDYQIVIKIKNTELRVKN